MKPIILDFRAEMPIYLQIVEQVRRMVTGGELAAGSQLPTVRQLARELGVNFNTVARAYRLLDEAGLISTQQGRGTYILEVPAAEVPAQLRRETLEVLTRRFLAEASGLGFSLGEIGAVFRQQVQLWQGEAGAGFGGESGTELDAGSLRECGG